MIGRFLHGDEMALRRIVAAMAAPSVRTSLYVNKGADKQIDPQLRFGRKSGSVSRLRLLYYMASRDTRCKSGLILWHARYDLVKVRGWYVAAM